jgi:hypothetical protein
MRCFASVLCVVFLTATFLSADEELAPDLNSGIQLMNNGQFLECYSFFKNYTELHPEDTKALFLLAMIKWKMMWISSYTKPEREDLEKLIDQLEGSFSAKKDDDPDALFFYTAVIGLRASIATWENEWWDAAQLGKKMKANAQDLVKMNPDKYDSYYLLGSYNYFADALPGYIKFVRILLFLPTGSKIDGMKQLIVANQKGSLTSGEAGRTLCIIYTYFEKQHDYGIKMCDNVLTLYPENYEVGLYKGVNLYFNSDWQQSYDWFQHVREQLLAYSAKHEKPTPNGNSSDAIVPVYRPLEREVRYWTSRTLIQKGQYEEARSLLQDLADPEIHQPYWLMRGVFLSLAQIEYKENHPEKAEALIQRVLRWSDVKDSHEKAKLLKEERGKVGTFDIDFL